MSSSTLLPLLSELDPSESAEGGTDPLGLYPISDALAVQMVPGVRERQQRVRFLTIIAASLAVASGDWCVRLIHRPTLPVCRAV